MNDLTRTLRQFAGYYEEFLRTSATGRRSHHTRVDRALRGKLGVDLRVLGISYQDAVADDSLHLDLRPPEDLELTDPEDEEGEEDESDFSADADYDYEKGQSEDEQDDASERLELEVASENSRHIFRRQQRDPYHRETIIGAGILGHRTPGGTTKVGPLLYWEVDLKYDAAHQRLRVFKRSPLPEINTLIFDRFLEEGKDIEALVEDIQKVIDDNDGVVTPAVSEKIFETFVGHSEDPSTLSSHVVAEESFQDWVRDLPERGASFLRAPIMVNGSRSQAFLIRDLRRLTEVEVQEGEGALAQLLDKEPPDAVPELRGLPHSFSESVDGKAPLLYPLQSNPAQRKVARVSEHTDVLTVQGPPGTGKSQTIANLVSHLIASGKSVLVTSHQRKAVEVVAKHLSPFDGMVLPLVQGDRQSVAKLRSQLESLLESSVPTIESLRDSVREGEKALAELDRELRALTVRFQELRAREHDTYEPAQAYGDLRGLDVLDPEDEVASADVPGLLQALPRWTELELQLQPFHHQLSDLLLPHGTNDTTRVLEAQTAEAYRELLELAEPRLTGAIPPHVSATKERMLHHAGSASDAAALLERLAEWLDSSGRDVVSRFEQMGRRPRILEGLRPWVRAGRTLGQDQIQSLVEEATSLNNWFAEYREQGDEISRLPSSELPQLEADWAILSEKGRSFWRWWIDPSVRAARKRLGQRMPIDRGTLDFSLDRLRLEIDWTRKTHRLVSLKENLEQALVDADVEPPEWPQKPSLLARRIKALAEQLSVLEAGPGDHLRALAKDFEGKQGGQPVCFDREGLSRIRKHVTRVHRALQRDRILQRFRQTVTLPDSWRERLEDLLDALATGNALDANQTRTTEDLLELEDQFDAFIERRDLEADALAPVPRSLQLLRERLEKSGRVPEWMEDLPKVFEAHRLGRLLRGSLRADPDDITDIARALREGESRRLRYVSEIVLRRHALHQGKGRRDPACNQQLLRLRKLLQRKRLTNSLIALRDQIDYRALLRVVPGWVCTIDDAARLFPSTPALFDVVIVDEASQCPQTVLLPLAVRTRKMIVVGDERQLQPTIGRFMPKAQVDALKRKHGLEKHPIGLFAEGGSSLLELANFRAAGSGFLDEHFRCEPPIIAWSNDRFYNNRLKVLTHRREGGFSPPLLVRRLKDADEDRDVKRNRVEAEAVVQEVRRYVDDPPTSDFTIGVISPFRPQADLIQALLEREFSSDPHKLEKHEIVASTADGFQGDERDIIIYSFRQGPSSSPNSIRMLERQEERFNVAFTRARKLGVNFISSPIERFPSDGVTRSWLSHARSVEAGEFGGRGAIGDDQFDSEFERKVCSRLRDRGLQVTTQVPCGPFRIDLVVRDSEGRVLAVECDGSWKMDEFGNLRPEDYQRQDLIERAGWVVHRVSGRRYHLNPTQEIDRIIELLERQTTRSERAALEGDLEMEAAQEPEPILQEEAAGVEEDSFGLEPQRETEAAESDQPRMLRKEKREEIRGLIRWSILQSKVRGSMFDRLADLDERLKADGQLNEEDHKTLKLLRSIAKREGFDPSEDILGS